MELELKRFSVVKGLVARSYYFPWVRAQRVVGAGAGRRDCPGSARQHHLVGGGDFGVVGRMCIALGGVSSSIVFTTVLFSTHCGFSVRKSTDAEYGGSDEAARRNM